MKANDALARLRPVQNGERQLFGNRQFRPHARLFARLYQHFPLGKVAPLQQQHLYFAAVFGIGEHARGQHLGVVDDQHVAGAQVFFDVAEDAVLGLACLPVVDQEPRSVARLGGRLRDQLLREVVIIIGLFQQCFSFRPPCGQTLIPARNGRGALYGELCQT